MLSQRLGVPVIVENRPGAGGTIALEALARSEPDGHTIGITTSSSVWGGRTLYTKLPFDPDNDFVPLNWFPVGPLLMAVPASLPTKTLKEWVEFARKNPVTMASYGPGSVPHLATEEFNKNYGTKVNVAHYKGEGPMWPDVANGITHAGIGSYMALAPHISRGKVRVLASIGNERSPRLPEVTSFESQGYGGELFKLSGGLMMLAPARTPPEALARISRSFVDAADSPKAAALREAFAIDEKPTSMAEAHRKWRDESPIWIKLTERLGIKIA